MGLVSRFGLWLDHRFPAKMSVEEVRQINSNLSDSIRAAVARIELIEELNTNKRVTTLGQELLEMRIEVQRLSSEINTIKTITNIKSRVVGNDIKPVVK